MNPPATNENVNENNFNSIKIEDIVEIDCENDHLKNLKQLTTSLENDVNIEDINRCVIEKVACDSDSLSYKDHENIENHVNNLEKIYSMLNINNDFSQIKHRVQNISEIISNKSTEIFEKHEKEAEQMRLDRKMDHLHIENLKHSIFDDTDSSNSNNDK
ncbi:hypothetical protein EDEG_02499 [Edhazardia aedis USNM 41457]|uniref:Uncharacterized protein n=1 Tax=Edhazardia aedis (strain USNM 41457) TaxID=1003232 RepID=J8ZTY9_EDHAE|nr:hypothetical protein EDEG_02499 [Edhazardia aedis USNM 41457]|eukprot:EJW03113.1 hypothetical protein EDEG_02499 [Edhazardia aedis USNM 41457]